MKSNQKLEEIIKKVCQKSETQLYDWRLKGTPNNQSLVVYITKQGDVTLLDCQKVSEELSDELDMRDIFDSHYILEVSSPGLSRHLKTSDHFFGAIGEKVKIQYLNEEEDVNTIKGKLISADKSSISVQTNADKSIIISYAQIKDARTVFVWHPKSSKANTKNRR